MHDLRHTGGTLVASTGASQKEIEARPGTSSDRAALIYQHASVNRDRWIAAALDTLANEVPLAVLAKCSPNGGSDDSASAQQWIATSKYLVNGAFARERLKGIEPSSSVWKTEALPLSYSREIGSGRL